MKSMKAIRQARRIFFFHSVPELEEFFPTLISTLDTLKPSHVIVTRGANNFNSLACNTNTFLHSFLIRTARELHTCNIIVDNRSACDAGYWWAGPARCVCRHSEQSTQRHTEGILYNNKYLLLLYRIQYPIFCIIGGPV